jgi:SAM-dependent methyltransferase
VTTGPFDADYYVANGQAGDRPALRWYVRMVRRYCTPDSGAPGPYLDYGCGTGHLLRRLSVLGPAAGFEVSAWAADAARNTAPASPVHDDPDELPTGSFAVLTAVHVLEHLDDAAAAAAAVTWRRVLRPGGRALVVTPDPAGRAEALSGPGWLGYRDATHINLKSHAQWRAFLADQGFDVLREGSDGLWNVPYGRLPRLVDAAVYAGPSLAQYLAGRLFLPPGSGESSVFVVQRRPTPRESARFG